MITIFLKKKTFKIREFFNSPLDFKMPVCSSKIKEFKTKIMEIYKKIQVSQGNHKKKSLMHQDFKLQRILASNSQLEESLIYKLFSNNKI